MMVRLLLVLTFTGLYSLAMETHVHAGDKKDAPKQDPEKKAEEPKEVVINSELINADIKDKVLTQSFSKTYVYKMTQGHTYQIDMITRNFDAFLRLEDPKGTQVAADDDSGGMLNSRIVYKPAVTGDFTICAMSLGGGSTGKFTLIVKDVTPPANKGAKGGNDGKGGELKLNKGKASVASAIIGNDPVYMGKKHKMFLVELEAGKSYQIDLTSQAFDPYLFLEDPDGKLLARDDDGGGFPNARITIKANAKGKHRIITTYFGGGAGDFNLTVIQTDLPQQREENKDAKDK